MTEYTAISKEPEVDDLPEHVREWANYIAMDEDGKWFAYSHKPVKIDGSYIEQNDPNSKMWPLDGDPVFSDWETSVREI